MSGSTRIRPLRIAFFLSTFPEISNTFVLEQIKGLIDRGHYLDLFAMHTKSLDGAHSDVAAYDLGSRLRHLPVPSNGWHRLAGVLPMLVRAKGARLAMLDTLNPMRYGSSAWKAVRIYTAASFARSGPYDVLHCQFGQHGPLAERLVTLGAVRGARLVTSFRGFDLSTDVPARPSRYRKLFRNGDLFLPVTNDFRERLLAHGVPAERVSVHRSGINLQRFQFEPCRPPVPGEQARLLFVGRLTEKKGLAYVLEALTQVLGRGRNCILEVIGDGALLPRLRAQCADLGIENFVSFQGSQTQKEIVQAMRKAHVFLAPSVRASNGDQEGIPNVLKEAMAIGVPVVSTWHSGIPELIEHGVSGLLAPERDAEALAALLDQLLDHPEQWPVLQDAARRKIEEEYDSERLNDALVSKYSALVADTL